MFDKKRSKQIVCVSCGANFNLSECGDPVEVVKTSEAPKTVASEQPQEPVVTPVKGKPDDIIRSAPSTQDPHAVPGNIPAQTTTSSLEADVSGFHQ